jgi:hypothetical protein
MSDVDVPRASGCNHIGAATEETSEAAIRALYNLPDHALRMVENHWALDMIFRDDERRVRTDNAPSTSPS